MRFASGKMHSVTAQQLLDHERTTPPGAADAGKRQPQVTVDQRPLFRLLLTLDEHTVGRSVDVDGRTPVEILTNDEARDHWPGGSTVWLYGYPAGGGGGSGGGVDALRLYMHSLSVVPPGNVNDARTLFAEQLRYGVQ